jgi:hypothetical protein
LHVSPAEQKGRTVKGRTQPWNNRLVDIIIAGFDQEWATVAAKDVTGSRLSVAPIVTVTR